MILALVLMLSASDVTYEIDGVVNNYSGLRLKFTSQDVKPAKLRIGMQNIPAPGVGIFTDTKTATTGYEGSLEYATSCIRNKTEVHGTYRFSFHSSYEKNEASCTYTGDPACQSRCSVTVSPKSCKTLTLCSPEFTYTLGNLR